MPVLYIHLKFTGIYIFHLILISFDYTHTLKNNYITCVFIPIILLENNYTIRKFSFKRNNSAICTTDFFIRNKFYAKV